MEKRSENYLAKYSQQNFGSRADMNAMFEIYKNLGLIPSQYRNWVDLTLAYYNETDSGLDSRKANQKLGIQTQQNIFKGQAKLADDILAAWIENDGLFKFSTGGKKFLLIKKLQKQFKAVKAENRNLPKDQKLTAFELVREAGNRIGLTVNFNNPYFLDVMVFGPDRDTIRFNPHEAALRLIRDKEGLGPEAVKLFKKYLKYGWDNLAKEEAQLMKKLTGRDNDRGHWVSKYYNGPPDVENQNAEIATINRRLLPGEDRLSQDPRTDIDAMRQAGIPDNTLQSFYELVLRSTGQLRRSGLQNRLDPRLANLVDMKEMSLDQAVGIQDQLEQRSQQINVKNLPANSDYNQKPGESVNVLEALKNYDPNFTTTELSPGYKEALAELSPSLSQQQSFGGPVTVVQKGVKPPTVVDLEYGSERISTFSTPSVKNAARTVMKNGAMHFVPGPIDLVQSALDSNVGQKLGQGDIPGALKETGKNLVGGLVQQFTTPEGLATTALLAGATAVAPAAAGIGAGLLGTGAAIQGAINFAEGLTAGQRGVSVDQVRKEKEDTWNEGLKQAAKVKSRIKKHLKRALEINGQLSLPF